MVSLSSKQVFPIHNKAVWGKQIFTRGCRVCLADRVIIDFTYIKRASDGSLRHVHHPTTNEDLPVQYLAVVILVSNRAWLVLWNTFQSHISIRHDHVVLLIGTCVFDDGRWIIRLHHPGLLRVDEMSCQKHWSLFVEPVILPLSSLELGQTTLLEYLISKVHQLQALLQPFLVDSMIIQNRHFCSLRVKWIVIGSFSMLENVFQLWRYLLCLIELLLIWIIWLISSQSGWDLALWA